MALFTLGSVALNSVIEVIWKCVEEQRNAEQGIECAIHRNGDSIPNLDSLVLNVCNFCCCIRRRTVSLDCVVIHLILLFISSYVNVRIIFG